VLTHYACGISHKERLSVPLQFQMYVQNKFLGKRSMLTTIQGGGIQDVKFIPGNPESAALATAVHLGQVVSLIVHKSFPDSCISWHSINLSMLTFNLRSGSFIHFAPTLQMASKVSQSCCTTLAPKHEIPLRSSKSGCSGSFPITG
jgi:hypothetical protein